MTDYYRDNGDDEGASYSGTMINVMVNEAVKLLTDADFGLLPTTRAVESLLRLAAASLEVRSLDFMAPKPELDKARELLTTFEDDGRLPITPAELECLDAIYGASVGYFNGVKFFEFVMEAKEDKDTTLLATTAGSGSPITEELYHTPIGCFLVNVSEGTAKPYPNGSAIRELKRVYHGRLGYEHCSIVPRAEDAFALLGDEEMSRAARWEREQEEVEAAANEHRYRITGQQPPWMTQTAQPTASDS